MNIMNFLKKNVKPATGCTEPIAIGYATCIAYHAIFNEIMKSDGLGNIEFQNFPPMVEINKIKRISIRTDRNVYKNALSTIIPGTNGQKGIAIAAALGLYCDPRKKMNLFEGISSEFVSRASQILNNKVISIQKINSEYGKPSLDIQITLEYEVDKKIRIAYVRIQEEHDNIAEIKINGVAIFKGFKRIIQKDDEVLPEKIEDLIKIVKLAKPEEKEEVYKGIVMNKKAAREGLSGKYGLQIGNALQKIAQQEGFENNIIMQVRINVGAAGDARMGGANTPIMTTSGSGNLGIMATIPIAIIGEMKNIDRDVICKATLLSHFITKLAGISCGSLSALCGCAIKAGIGATAAITYLLNGSIEQIHAAINLMAANNTGFICDGAKEGCALKLSTAAGTAIECALLALNGIRVPSDNGIIFDNAENTIKAIGQVSNCMTPADIEIIKVMNSKIT